MKKIMNKATDVVEEMLSGMDYIHHDLIHQLESNDVIVRNKKQPGKVALISGGGSGHEPAHAGFVGEGMLAGAVCGAVFTSPTPDQILAAIKACDEGAGVFLIIKNYSGDIMNFEMAQDMAEMEGISVSSVIVDDDIAVEDSLYTQGKRGVAGTVLVHKILGYAAQTGKNLDEIKALADKVVQNIHTVGVALSGATVPEVGKPGFILAEDEIEFGVGIHGEPGYRKEKLVSSYELAEELTSKLLQSFEYNNNDQFGLLINGLGSTPLMEQYIFANDVAKLLAKSHVNIEFKKLGNYMTSIDMAGISLTLIKLDDQQWLEALKAPVNTIAW